MLNDEFPARFVLDTGADGVSAVSATFAEKMGVLEPMRERASGLGLRNGKIRRLYGTRLKIGGALFNGFDFISLPLAKLEPYWGRKIDGLLGGNILKSTVLSVNYEKRTLVLSEHLGAEARDFEYRLPLTVLGTTPMVEAQVLRFGDQTPISGRFIVDTGVRLSFFNTPFSKTHGLLEQSPKVIENITGYGIGGIIVEKVGRVAQISLGGAKLKKPLLQISTRLDGLYASSLFDGIIGADLLSRFTVVFDFPGKMLYLRPNKWFNTPFIYDMSGISFTFESEGKGPVRVVKVVKQSPAEDAGVREGDILLEVDGRAAVSYTMSDLKDHFRKEGRKVSLKIDRQGHTLTVVFIIRSFV
jgi:membrane-associated protease RseP (regulator of RpoE activity)